MSYKQKPLKEEAKPFTPNIIKKQKAYDDKGLEYVLQSQDYREMEFYDAVRRRPDTHRKYVNSIYRIKTDKKFVVGNEKDEALIYHMQETVQNFADEHIQIDGFYGYWFDIDARTNKNLQGQPAKVQVLGEIPVFEIPFSPEQVDEIINSSKIDVNQFYVAEGSTRGPDITTGDKYAIKNKEDFKNGTYEELVDMGRYNYSSREPRLEQWRREGEVIKKQSQTINSLTGRSQRNI